MAELPPNDNVNDLDTQCVSLATQLVKTNEGYRRFPYPDTLGTFAVGHGTNFFTRGMTEVEADYFTLRDVTARFDELQKLPWFAKQNVARKAALIDLAYELGLRGLLNFTFMIRCLDTEAYASAANALRHSKLADEAPARAKRNADIIFNGVMPEEQS